MSDIIQILLTAILSGLFALLGLWFARRNLRTTKYIETITSERIKWIQIVRNDFNDLISSILFQLHNIDFLKKLQAEKISLENVETSEDMYFLQSDESIQAYLDLKQKIGTIETNFEKILSHREIANKALLLKLKMNPKEDLSIITDLDIIINIFSNYSKTIKDFDLDLNSIVLKVQDLLKREWEKVKGEVEDK